MFGSLRYLLGHPAYKRAPLVVAARVVGWELAKIVHVQPVVSVHSRSRMRLTPGRRRGIHGLVFAFREEYEPGVRAAIDRFVLSDAVVYDIGANIGLWTLRLSERVGTGGRVVAFEPVPPTAGRLAENAALSHADNVIVREVALSDRTGSSEIFVPYDPGRASLAAEGERDDVYVVETGTLDDHWASEGEPDVSFVKIDVEGSEPMVLAGGKRFFGSAKPVVACEVNRSKLAALGRAVDEIYEFFDGIGYRSFAWDESTGSFEPAEEMQSGDIVFLPEGMPAAGTG